MPQIRFDQIPSPDREQDFKTGERIVRPKRRFNITYNPKKLRPKSEGRKGNELQNGDQDN